MPEFSLPTFPKTLARCTAAACLAAAGIGLLSQPAAAAPKESLFLKYYIHSSGFRVATLRFEIDFTDKSYQVVSSMKTKGLIGLISGSEFVASARGAMRRFTPIPAQFKMISDNNKREERTSAVTWDKNQTPTLKRSWKIGTYKQNSLKKTVRAKQPDPLTALLTAGFQSRENLCKQSFRVLDGKTVYDIAYQYVKRDDFTGDERGVYTGEAHRCRITYTPVAGLSVNKWKKLKAEPNKGVYTFDVWMAPIKARNVGTTAYVPVAGSANMDGRQTTAHLVAASLSGAPLNARSAQSQ